MSKTTMSRTVMNNIDLKTALAVICILAVETFNLIERQGLGLMKEKKD